MRYYLNHIRSDHTIYDPEGSEHDSIDAARSEAVDGAREMMAAAVRAGRDVSDWFIEIVDAEKKILDRVSFKSVIQPDGDGTWS